jgi:integrase/recombinase XerD
MKTTIKSVLRNEFSRKDGKCRIEFLFYFEGKQYRVSTGKNVEKEFWNQTNESVNKKSLDAPDINKYLSDRLAAFHDYLMKKNAMKEKISIDEIKATLKGISLKSLRGNNKLPLIGEAFDKYVELNKLKPGTINNLNMTKRVVNDFVMRHYRRIQPTVDIVDFNFLESFKRYLRKERERPNNMNTIAKRLKILNSVIRYSIRCGAEIKNPFENYKIEHGKHKEVALNEDEYNRFYTLKLPSNSCSSMKLTKDLFTFSCETALRFSDLMDLKWENIDEELSSFKKIQVKTERPVFVPISKRAKSLLIKYRHRNPNIEYVFPKIDVQVVNRYLKNLASMAGIDKNLTSHVGRHTFGTFWGSCEKVSPFQLCSLMGHSDISMTQRYVNIADKDLKDTMQSIWNKA